MALKGKKLPEKHGEGSKSEFLQRFKSNPLVFSGTLIVLVIVIVAFVFVPAMGRSRGPGEAGDFTFGYYNKTPISYVSDNYFYNWQQTLARYYQSSINDTNYIYIMYQIWGQAFTEAAIQAGKLDEMKQAGFTATADKVDRELASLPRYQENGRFSLTKFKQESNSTRMNLWSMIQESISADTYTSDFTGLKAAFKESSFISSMAFPQRAFDMVSFQISSYPDSEVVSFAADNPDLFRVCYLSRITVNSGEREARQILASIENGSMTFEDAAIAQSQDYDAEKGGDMGSRMANELELFIPEESDRKELANLPQGSFSKIIQTGEKSWAFFKANENSHPADTSDPAIMEKIRSYVLSGEWGRVQDWLISRAENFISEAKEWGFDSAVANSFIQKQNFGPLPVNYGDLDMFPSLATSGIRELQNAGKNETFWRIAFSTPIRTPSAPIVEGDNVLVVFPLEETVFDPDNSSYLESYFENELLPRHTNEAIRNYFLNNSKFDDRFSEVFQRNWGN
ncbi:MAG: SurA N-terminal domain-containing protein [Treponema sp.]|nr:SurA N-terminal domain-containing protein [Treponema sp.]